MNKNMTNNSNMWRQKCITIENNSHIKKYFYLNLIFIFVQFCQFNFNFIFLLISNFCQICSIWYFFLLILFKLLMIINN